MESDNKNTEWMKNKLLESDDLNSIMDKDSEVFVESFFSDRINELLIGKNLSKSSVTKESGLSSAYVYELFNGYKTPTRDRCILLGYGLKASFTEMQELLKLCNLRELYAKNKRDAVIIFCIHKHMSVMATDEMLFEMKLETLLAE